jgi:predicted ribosomally synthesized peptide with SipW-like signal peptide
MNMRIMRPVALLGAASVLVAGGGTWAAWSAVPDAGKQFHGCYFKDKGQPYKYFVMIDPAEGTKCPAGFGAVDWSAGGGRADGHVYTAFASASGHVTFAVPAGKYVANGKALMANKGTSSVDAQCNLMTSTGADILHDLDFAGATVPASGFATLAVQAVLDLPAETQFDLVCVGSGVQPSNVRLVATTVDAVN